MSSFILIFYSAPIHCAWLNKSTPFGIPDICVSVFYLLFLSGETIADEQMWNFQQDKKKRLETSEDMAGRNLFYREGLYRFSRHPNYFCEVISIT